MNDAWQERGQSEEPVNGSGGQRDVAEEAMEEAQPSEGQEYKCKLCDQTLGSKKSLQRHVRLHKSKNAILEK